MGFVPPFAKQPGKPKHGRNEPRLNHDTPTTLVSVRRCHGRATLTLSTGETLDMPRAMLKERPYRGGMPFDRASFDAFLTGRSYPFAMDKAVALLAMRGRTRKEIRDALVKNAYPEHTVERVLTRLDEAGYVDDADFAGHWASSRTSKGIGARRIRMELRQKGVEASVIEETLSAMNTDEQLSGACKIARRAANGKDLSLRTDRQKVMAALMRRGFDYDTARQALAVLDEED